MSNRPFFFHVEISVTQRAGKSNAAARERRKRRAVSKRKRQFALVDGRLAQNVGQIEGEKAALRLPALFKRGIPREGIHAAGKIRGVGLGEEIGQLLGRIVPGDGGERLTETAGAEKIRGIGGKIQQIGVGKPLRRRPVGNADGRGAVGQRICRQRQHAVLIRRNGQRRGGDIPQAGIGLPHVLEVDVAAEVAQHGRNGIQAAQRIRVADGEAGGKQAAVVDQVLVADGDDAAAVRLRLHELTARPRKRALQNGVRCGGGVHVEHQQAQIVGERRHVAQRIRVAGERAVKAEGMIKGGKFPGGHAVHPRIAVALKARGAAAVQIVVAGEDKHGNARVADARKPKGKRLVALARAVEGQVAGENQRVRLLGDHLSDKRFDQRVAVRHRLAVAPLDQIGEERAVIRQRRGDIV